MESINKILDIVDDHKEEMKDCEYKTIMDSLMELKNKTDKDSDSDNRVHLNPDSDESSDESYDSDDSDFSLTHVFPTHRIPRINNINENNNRFIITEDANGDMPHTFVIELVPGTYTIDEIIDKLNIALNANTAKNNMYSITRHTLQIKMKVSEGQGIVKIEDIVSRDQHRISYRGMVQNTLNRVLGICPNTYINQNETHIGFRQYNLGS